MWHRSPTVAGSFYPSNPKKLHGDIQKYMSDVEEKSISGEVIGLISPHAGYVYSGPVAAYSFARLKDVAVDFVVVMAPSHRVRFSGASVIPGGTYETPLGNVTIDSVIGERLAGEPNFSFVKEVHMYEHSLEVQVPFLQEVLESFTLVPVIVGTVELGRCREIADVLSDVLSGETRRYVIILSTDLSHYLAYDEARRIDGVFVDTLKKFDENALSRVLTGDQAQACGAGPVLAGMILSKKLGAGRVEVLKYATSGDTAGGRDQVVGYLSAAFVK